MFEKLSTKLHDVAERMIVWAIGRVLIKYSAVIAGEFGRVDAESKKFQAEVHFVAADHFRHLQHLETKTNAALAYCAALDSAKFGKPVHGSRSAGPIHHEHRESIRKQFTRTLQEDREKQ